MPILSFKAQSDYSELLKMQEVIKKTEEQIKNFKGSDADLQKLQQQLTQAKNKFMELAQASLKSGSSIELALRKGTKTMQSFNTDCKKMANEIAKTMAEIQGMGHKISDVFKSLSTLAGFALPTMGILEFLDRVKRVRAEFQDMESSMQVFLGSERKGSLFMKDLEDYAWYNMFDFKDLVGASQQLIAYGNDAKGIITTLDRLSNIATATHASLGEMVGLYNRAKSLGSVDSKSMQSWATKGLVIKDVLRDMKENANVTKISFEKLNEVLEHVVDKEGGMFHGIMESQMQNINAEIGQLQDNFDLFLNSVGEELQGPLTVLVRTAGEFVGYLGDNWERVATQAGIAAAGILTYKGLMGLYANAVRMQAEQTHNQLEKLSGEKRKLDKDIQNAVTRGIMSQSDAERWQNDRDALRERGIAIESLDAQKKVDVAVTAEQTASENVNTAATELNTTQKGAATSQQAAHTGATARDSAAQSQNTAATVTSTVATKANTSATKTANTVKLVFAATVKKVTASVKALGAALKANAFGIAMTVITAILTLLPMFKKNTEEATGEVAEFGKETIEGADRVKALYAALEATTKGSKAHNEAIKELTKELRENNIAGKDEEVTIEKINASRERLIELIMQEGRERIKLAAIKSLERERDGKRSEALKSIKDNIDNNSSSRAASISGSLANLLLSSAIGDEKVRNAIRGYKDVVRLDGSDTESQGNIENSIEQTLVAQFERALGNAGIDGFGVDKKKLTATLKLLIQSEEDLDKVQREVAAELRDAQSRQEAAKGVLTYDFSPDIESAAKAIAAMDSRKKTGKKYAVDLEGNKDGMEDYELVSQEEYDKHMAEKEADERERQRLEAEIRALKMGIIEAETREVTEKQDAWAENTTAESANQNGTAFSPISHAASKSFVDMPIFQSNEKTVALVDIEVDKKKVQELEELLDKLNGKTYNFVVAPTIEDVEKEAEKVIDDAVNGDVKSIDNFKGAVSSLQQAINATEDPARRLRYQQQLQRLQAKDPSKNSPDAVAQRGYAIKEMKRKEGLKKTEQSYQRDFQARENVIEQMEDGSLKSLSKAQLDHDKQMESLRKETISEAERLEKLDRDLWLKADSSRKDYMWSSNEDYQDLARKNLGIMEKEQSAEIKFANEKRKIQEEALAAEVDFLSEFGNLYQKRDALLKDHNEKIRKAEEGYGKDSYQAKKARSDKEKALYEHDTATMSEYLQKWGNFQQQRAAIAEKAEHERENANSIADVLSISRQERLDTQSLNFEELKDNVDWENVFSQLDSMSVASLEELKKNFDNAFKLEDVGADAYNEILEALDKIDDAIKQRQRSRSFGSVIGGALGGIVQMRQERADNKEAMQKATTRYNAAKKADDEAENDIEAKRKDIFSHLQDSKFGDKFKDVKLSDVTEENLQKWQNEIGEADGGKLSTLAQAFGLSKAKKKDTETELANANSDVEKAKGMQGMSAFAATDAIIHGVNDNMQSMVGLLDKWELGETGFAQGFKDFAESSQYATAAFDSLKNGDIAGVISNLDSALGSLGTALGKWGIGGGLFGESDATLHDDMEKLSRSNEALRYAIQELADDLQDASVQDVTEIYDTQKKYLEEARDRSQDVMGRAGAAYNNGFLGIGGKGSSNRKINQNVSKSDWSYISDLTDAQVREAADLWKLSSEQMAKIAKYNPTLWADLKKWASEGYEDAAQYMDSYIEYDKQLQELEDAHAQALTQISFDDVLSEFKSLLMNMDAEASDFADNFEKMMQTAVINSMVDELFKDDLKEWYEGVVNSMKMDDEGHYTIDAAEQAAHSAKYEAMAQNALDKMQIIKKTMGWDGSQTQQASSRSIAGMSQDTGDAIEGRLTAMQIAVEAIRSSEAQQAISLMTISDNMLQTLTEFSAFNNYYDNIQTQLAKSYLELQTISENTGAIVKPIQDMQLDVSEILKHTKNL